VATTTAELPADIVTAESGQHDIKEDEVRVVAGTEIDGEIAAGAGEDLEAFAAEDLAQAEGDVGVILDDQNALGGRLHGFREWVGL
jgi:hypothetical protein